MCRTILILMSLMILFTLWTPSATASSNADKCQTYCEAQFNICKKSCRGDEACEKECTTQEDQCKAGCD